MRFLIERSIESILRWRIQRRNPTLRSHHTAIWDYAFRHPESIQIGRNVTVGAFVEIVVYKHTQHSAVEGSLVLSDDVVICTGVNIRAAGGEILIGKGSAVGQHSVLVAANHQDRKSVV